MKKFLIGALLVVFGGLSLSAQDNLRNSVAVVRPSYSKENLAFFGQMSSTLIQNGYITSARALKSMELGKGFGSGFVYATSSGSAYIVTNKHVVKDASMADITFFTENNDSLIYQNCPIVAVSSNLDIALVALPAEAKIDRSLKFYTQPVQDGQDVWSAGYPSLGNKPAWQLGKGIISNQNVQDEKLANPSVSFIFQHTAQIDPGSSGGPLLIKNESGYEIAGINTWKAAGRENAGFSIPAKAISQFIEKTLIPDEKENPVKEIAGMLFKEPDLKLMATYISFDLVTKITPSSFDAMISNMSNDAKKLVVSTFQEGDPVNALRLLIADAVITKIKKEKAAFNQLETKTISDSEMQVIYITDRKEYSNQWIKEQNTWKINHFSLVSLENITAKNGLATDADFNLNISLQVDFPLIAKYGQVYAFSWDWSFSDYMLTHIRAGYGTLLAEEFDNETLKNKEKYFPYFDMEIGAGGYLPLRFSSIYLIPYTTGMAGIGLGEFSNFYIGFRSGLNVGFKVSKRNVLYIGPEYSMKFLKKSEDNDVYQSNRIPSIGLKLGIYF